MTDNEQGSKNGEFSSAALGSLRSRPSDVGKYLLFILISVTIVLSFAMFQHLVVLNIPLRDIRPGLLIVPTMVGGVFGYLLAKIRVLHERSNEQLELIVHRDQLLEQEITVRKEVEARLRVKKTRLEAANEELKSFSYSVSHDLRSPLRAIHGFNQALVDEYRDSMDEEAQHYLDRVDKGCQRMEEMIDSLLVLSRVSQADVVSAEVDLSKIATESLGELAERDAERHVVTEVEPGLVVRGDYNLLQLVMDNLLGNAWKYTSKTRAPVISFKSIVCDGVQAFCVQDNGVGFDAEYSGRLFTAFSRLHHQTDFPGSGIGLATVQRALLRQGGTIWAEGEEGKGARFCFSL